MNYIINPNRAIMYNCHSHSITINRCQAIIYYFTQNVDLEGPLDGGHDEGEAGGVDKVDELGVEQGLKAGTCPLGGVLFFFL